MTLQILTTLYVLKMIFLFENCRFRRSESKKKGVGKIGKKLPEGLPETLQRPSYDPPETFLRPSRGLPSRGLPEGSPTGLPKRLPRTFLEPSRRLPKGFPEALQRGFQRCSSGGRKASRGDPEVIPEQFQRGFLEGF